MKIMRLIGYHHNGFMLTQKHFFFRLYSPSVVHHMSQVRRCQ